MIPGEVIHALSDFWAKQSLESKIIKSRSIGGGSINSAYYLETLDRSYFLKYNTAAAHPHMFSSEFKGLLLLSDSSTIRIPKPMHFHEGQQYSFILMEYIDQGKTDGQFWEDFAMQLAQMHQSSCDYFGLDFDNYMGSLAQSNQKHSSFVDFFIKQRLIPQIKMARDKGFLSSTHIRQSERLFAELPSIFPTEKPALIHGDLWSGNFMNDERGGPVIMDPAVYYGHREVDIAMTTMFGGFAEQFYQSYHQYYPLEKNWETRLPIYNLYPILIHINLFGSSYLHPFDEVLQAF